MDKTREDSDASAAKKEKKSKKNKLRTDDLLVFGAGEDDVEINADLPNEKGQKNRKKKRKSELNEDEDEDKHDKGNLVNDGDIQKSDNNNNNNNNNNINININNNIKKKKKRKRNSSENEQGQDDEPAGENNWDPKPGKKKISDGKEIEVSVEDCQEYMFKKTDKKKKKRNKGSSEKTQMKENKKGQHDELIVEADCEPKTGEKKTRDVKGSKISMEACQEDEFEKTVKEKKKRKKDSSEKTQMKENEKGQHDETTVERDCEPKIGEKKTRDGKVSEISTEGCQEDEFEKTDKKKKMQKQKKKNKTDTEMNVTVSEASTLKTRNNEDSKDSNGKKKTKSVGSSEKQRVKVKGSKVNKKTTESVESNNTEKTKAKGKSKKVSFAGQVEVFPSSDTEPEKQPTKGDGLVRGKRFTPEEDAIVKQAVLHYVEAHDLGEDGLKMVLRCNSHTGMKKCWQEIGTCIPYRPYTAVYSRAHILFERSENRSWSPEEIELLRESHKKHGNDWKKVADELGKHRFHVKDTWRRIKFENLKLGKWSQEEYQNLFDLVNMDYQMKIDTEKKSKHGMLRDNIPWTAISEKLSTRSDSTCCVKWYNQLTSSLVAEKKWSDADDYRMIGALYELDAACVEDVHWDNLLEHRPGDICRKRWDQMVKYVDHGSKLFAEQVDILAKRYRPDLAETREAWDNKPIVP